MLEELQRTPSAYQPSEHWLGLNKIHLEQLNDGGINNFKRSVNMKYFNWGILGIIAHQLKPVIIEFRKGNFSILFKTRFRGYNAKLGKRVMEFDFLSAQIYKVKEKVHYFGKFRSYKEIKSSYEKSRIRFIMAHQIESLPDKSFDYIINVSSLHEMTRPQIHYYFEQIDRLGKKYFYQKQWRKSRVKDNNYIKENEYPVPKKWKTIYHRRHQIQSWFFEALYKITT